jgi:hypothetical protein
MIVKKSKYERNLRKLYQFYFRLIKQICIFGFYLHTHKIGFFLISYSQFENKMKMKSTH